MHKAAHISDCGRYRFSLTRRWGASPACKHAVFIMLNPSTADADKDDATIRKLIGFCKLWKYGSFEVVNVYAYRATKPKDLYDAADPFGPHNGRHIAKAAYSAPDVIVCAWGANEVTPEALYQLQVSLHDKPLHCLGRTKDGHPRHPLYVPYSQPLEQFQLPTSAKETP